MRNGRTLSFWAILITVAFALTALGSGDAEAKRKKRKKRKKAQVVHKIDQRALGELMGPFKFGMSKKKVTNILASEIKKRYDAQIKDTNDVYAQDKLRRKQQKELARISKSYTQFKGKKTGWDVSIIDDQFGHKTDESMLVYWENVDGKDQRRFFFFHDGQLYKMFVALNSSMLKDDQRTFDYFKTIMVGRYGKGSVVEENGKRVALEWRTRKYHVKAIDKLEFYGSFCLMVADPAREKTLIALRAAGKPDKKSSPIIDTMLEKDDGSSDPSLDENAAAVRKATGK